MVASERLRAWVIDLFIGASRHLTREDDRIDVLAWLEVCREILASDLTKREKFVELNRTMSARKTASVMAHSVAEAIRNYKNSTLPLAVKCAIPITLLAAPFLGGQGAGIAALGTAIGIPALALIFVGSAGVTAIIESVAFGKDESGFLAFIMETIARDEVLRQASKAMKSAMTAGPMPPRRHDVSGGSDDLARRLRSMDPHDFECHVMSFFSMAGMESWVTKASNDMGVDGFARHSQGLIVVQCKRYAANNPVGRPEVQKLKGVIEENNAFRGYLVTTSRFTAQARESGGLNGRLVLVDMDDVICWHMAPPPTSLIEGGSGRPRPPGRGAGPRPRHALKPSAACR